ncbi:hypothetical protein [Bacillus sp. NPDC077027]|uniref:hypothetical protein n=1 Tax=Bacillus sp. NPDC077027 TaxID=3390548 RepID=UPI003D0076ED
MQKKSFIILITLLFTLVGCSSESVESHSPDYIKESFGYFKSIKSLVKSIKDGEEVDKAIKSNFEKQSEFNDWVDANYDPNDGSNEKGLLITYYQLIKISLDNLETGIEGVTTSSIISSIENSLSRLEKIYKNYGYKPKD